MRIANQLFDRSSLNPGKKDAKLTVDKQATAGTAASVPKKVIDCILFVLILVSIEWNFPPLKKTRNSSRSPKNTKVRTLSFSRVTTIQISSASFFCPFFVFLDCFNSRYSHQYYSFRN